MKWYAVRTEPNREGTAVSYLRTWIEDVYMPICDRPTMLDLMDEKRENVIDTQRVLAGPILRGYLFARLEMSDCAAAEIAQTRGVLRLVPNNFRPGPIPDSAFSMLRAACDALAASGLPEENYSYMVGKIMRATSGTYAGSQGKCRDIVRGHAILQIEMFKSEIPVPIPISCIDPQPVAVPPDDHLVKCALFGYKGSRKRAF